MLLGRDFHWMMRNKAGGGILAPQSPQNEPRIWHFPPKTSKFGSIHVTFTQSFKRPLNGRSRRVHAGALHGSLTSAVTALQCTSWLIDTLEKEKDEVSPPVAVDQYNNLLEKYSVESTIRGGG